MKMTISVDDELRDRMKQHEHINWSSVAAHAFETRLAALEADTVEVRSLRYADEKLTNALATLRGPGSIQERLHGAYVYNLIHVPKGCIPAEVKQDFEDTMKACVRAPAKGTTGRAHAAISKMPDEEAAAHAEILARTTAAVRDRYRDATGGH